MTKILVGEVGSYTFDASAQTVTLTGLPTLLIEQVLVITNVKDNANDVIYQFDLAPRSGTIAANVITLVYDTTSMADTDPLQIWVDLKGSQLDPLTNDLRTLTDSKPSTDNAAVAAYGVPKVSFETTQKAFKYTSSILQINFNETLTGSGSSTTADPGVLILSSGAAASSSAKYISKFKITQSVTKGLMFRNPVVFPDAGVANNVREFGLYDEVSQNGWLLRLDGTTFKFIVFNNGTPSIDVDSTTWDDPFTLDTNLHLYEIQTKSVASGDFDIFIDKKLRHSIRSLGTSLGLASATIDNPIYFRNENTTNTSDVKMNIAPTSVLDEGDETVKVSDGIRTLLLSEDRRALVQQFGNELMGENFDEPIDTVQRWEETIAGAATKTEAANTHTLALNVTTGATDSITEIFRETMLAQTVGSFSSFEVGAKFGATLETGNIREWGYLDEPELNGVFFRIDGSTLEFVTVKGGVETVSTLAGELPNINFHLYGITQLGAGKIAGFIDNKQVIDFTPAAGSLVGSSNKRPFLKMYNTGVLAGVPTPSEFHWVNLIDKGGTSTSITGVDENNIIRKAQVNSAGELKVEVVPGAAPVASNPVEEIQTSTVAGTVDYFYTITNLKTLTVQRFVAGYVTPSSGDSVIELYWAPNGNTTGIVLIANKNGSNTGEQTLNISQIGGVPFDGDGTAAILIRRRKTGGGSTEITGAFFGFEIDT